MPELNLNRLENRSYREIFRDAYVERELLLKAKNDGSLFDLQMEANSEMAGLSDEDIRLVMSILIRYYTDINKDDVYQPIDVVRAVKEAKQNQEKSIEEILMETKNKLHNTVYCAFGGDRFVSVCISETKSKALRKVKSYDSFDDDQVREIKITDELAEALKDGKAFLINCEFEKPNDDAVQVDDEGCWWLSGSESDHEMAGVNHEIKLNKRITDV